jgi:hypothetical protein
MVCKHETFGFERKERLDWEGQKTARSRKNRQRNANAARRDQRMLPRAHSWPDHALPTLETHDFPDRDPKAATSHIRTPWNRMTFLA